MKHLIVRKLNNITRRMIERLFTKAEELKLHKNDFFVLTSKSMIESHLRSYILAFKVGESLSPKSFVKEIQQIIDSLTIVKEDPFLI